MEDGRQPNQSIRSELDSFLHPVFKGPGRTSTSCSASTSPTSRFLLFLLFYFVLFLLPIPSTFPHPVACVGTCWTELGPLSPGPELWVFPPPTPSPTSSSHSDSKTGKTCQQVLALCSQESCVCVCVSLFPAMKLGDHGRSDFTSFPVSTWNKPQ